LWSIVIKQDIGHDVQIQSVDGKFMQRNFVVAPLSWYNTMQGFCFIISSCLCSCFIHVYALGGMLWTLTVGHVHVVSGIFLGNLAPMQ